MRRPAGEPAPGISGVARAASAPAEATRNRQAVSAEEEAGPRSRVVGSRSWLQMPCRQRATNCAPSAIAQIGGVAAARGSDGGSGAERWRQRRKRRGGAAAASGCAAARRGGGRNASSGGDSRSRSRWRRGPRLSAPRRAPLRPVSRSTRGLARDGGRARRRARRRLELGGHSAWHGVARAARSAGTIRRRRRHRRGLPHSGSTWRAHAGDAAALDIKRPTPVALLADGALAHSSPGAVAVGRVPAISRGPSPPFSTPRCACSRRGRSAVDRRRRRSRGAPRPRTAVCAAVRRVEAHSELLRRRAAQRARGSHATRLGSWRRLMRHWESGARCPRSS